MNFILGIIGFFAAMSFALRFGYVKGRQAGKDEVYGKLVQGQLDERDNLNALKDQADKKSFIDMFSKKKEIDQQ